MAIWSTSFRMGLLGLLSFFLLHPIATTTATGALAIRIGIIRRALADGPIFREATSFVNGEKCGSHDIDKIHISMTLDANYLRGTIAAVFSILQHSTCPENFMFHFLFARHEPDIFRIISSTFPFLKFKIYRFDSNRVRGKISKSIRQALDQPLNYARIYLADILPSYVDRIIYLDSDIILVDDISKLLEVDLGKKVVAAPEHCNANFTTYFTDAFWSEPTLTTVFEGRRPCYFNTGVMVLDVKRWKKEGYTQRIEAWMFVQKQKRIYQLGSLPPFLLVFAGNITTIDHRWNQHGLGGDNFEGKCRDLHPGPISLLHWSGKGKPWLRLDSRKPCPIDYIWAPYDLYRSSRTWLEDF